MARCSIVAVWCFCAAIVSSVRIDEDPAYAQVETTQQILPVQASSTQEGQEAAQDAVQQTEPATVQQENQDAVQETEPATAKQQGQDSDLVAELTDGTVAESPIGEQQQKIVAALPSMRSSEVEPVFAIVKAQKLARGTATKESALAGLNADDIKVAADEAAAKVLKNCYTSEAMKQFAKAKADGHSADDEAKRYAARAAHDLVKQVALQNNHDRSVAMEEAKDAARDISEHIVQIVEDKAGSLQK